MRPSFCMRENSEFGSNIYSCHHELGTGKPTGLAGRVYLVTGGNTGM
jgi:hypothetical protein